MAGLFKGDIDEFKASRARELKRRGRRAGDAPAIPLRPEEAAPMPMGNFADLDGLLAELGSAPVIELGNPLPQEKFLPKPRVGDCHASHNRFLLDEGED